jgi:hypothetical protein
MNRPRPGHGSALRGRGRFLIEEAVPEPEYGFDLTSGRTELGSQAPDVHVDRTRFDEVVIGPGAFDELIARQHTVAVGDELMKEKKLPPGEVDILAVD